MALIFMDGFDFYTSPAKRYTGNSYCSINAAAKRNGTQGLRFTQSGYGALTKSFAQKTTIVVGCAVKVDAAISAAYDIWSLRAGSTIHVKIRFNTDGTISVYRDTVLLGTSASTDSWRYFEWNYYEVKAVINDTTGSVIVKRDGITLLTLTDVDTCNGTSVYCDNLLWGISRNSATYFDDLYIDDADFNGDIIVETLYPTVAGNSTQWTPSAGSNYACVDEPNDYNSDTDYVSSSTANQIDTYTFGNLASTTGAVLGVQMNVVARMDDAGTNKVAPVVRPTTIDNVGTTRDITQVYEIYSQMYVTNPDNSSAWEIADVNGAEFGFKLIE